MHSWTRKEVDLKSIMLSHDSYFMHENLGSRFWSSKGWLGLSVGHFMVVAKSVWQWHKSHWDRDKSELRTKEIKYYTMQI
jgi:hypothetical protein